MIGRGDCVRTTIAVLCMLFCVTVSLPAWAAQGEEVFYNQGQAPYDSRNPGKSRNEAIADLKAEVLRQAIENLVEEEALSKKKADIQNLIMKTPDRYLQGLQIVAQEIENGKLRLAGQVTVKIDELSRSLGELGLKVTASAAVDDQTPSHTDAAGPTVTPEQAKAADDQTGEEVDSEEEEKSVGEQATERDAQQSPPVMSIQLARKTVVFWSVAERWEQTSPWHIPSVDELGTAVQALFAGSVRQEAQAMPWTLSLPDASMEVLEQDLDVEKNFPVDQALSRGKGKSAGVIVIGTATQRRRADGSVSLVADLNLLDGLSGERVGEVHRELPLGPMANPGDYAEEIIKLAAWITPELDRLVRTGLAEKGDDGARQPTKKPVETPGREPRVYGWVLMIRGMNSLAQWQALEQFLRQRFEDMEIAGLEYSAGSAMVQLEKVGDNLPAVFREFQLAAWRIEIQEEDAVNRTIHLSFIPQSSTQ